MEHGKRMPARTLACIIAALLSTPTLLAAKEIAPINLGGGLGDMVAEWTNRPAAKLSAQQAAASAASGKTVIHPMQFDAAGRVLVHLSLDGRIGTEDMLQSMRGMGGIEIVAWDNKRGAGAIEAYLPVDALVKLAQQQGVLAIVPVSPPVTNVGTTDTQGVVQHRVDKVPAGIDGSGITVGVLSDTYDSPFTRSSAAADIASGDLPGAGNPLGNTQPIVVIQDLATSIDTDEGRAMLQIVHDIAPKSRLGFATAFGGELNFANNIRALAGLSGAPGAVPGFKADIIVDDVFYLTEPFFQDGIIAQAVDDVTAAGVAYFSSAGNTPATQSYDSQVRIVPANTASMQNTNLNFTGVDPTLYAGGFHNFAEGKEPIDIAQTITVANGSSLSLQWNELFDPQPPTPVGQPLATGTGTVPPNGTASFTFQGTAGRVIRAFVDADTTTTGTPVPDLTLALLGPDGARIQFVDTGTNPEAVLLALPATGTYTVVVDSFLPEQFGDFQYTVQEVDVSKQVASDYNLLLFTTNGQFVTALNESNLFTQRPIELTSFQQSTTLQLVIARANVPSSNNRNVADRIRYIGFRGVAPQEHFSYLSSTAFGHNSARGGISVAAYPFFAPFVPETFTSPGPATIYFDENNRRLARPVIRRKPDLAAMDGGNNTFFGGDSVVDADALPNFFGTSAASPHAAAIAALVLDAAGGPGTLNPQRMREILQDSAFLHDLDPYFSSGFDLSLGSLNLLAVNATADGSPLAQFDPNVFTLTQIGIRPLLSFSISGIGGNPTQTPSGVVFDSRDVLGQPFIIGRTVGLAAAEITGTFAVPADAPGVAGQFKQLDLNFRPGAFRSGDLLSFGVDRDEADVAGPGGAAGGNSADLLGGGILIPSGQFVPGGARFFGTYEGGTTFKGEFFNLIGKGYSPLDGFGFINAEAAVNAVLKTPPRKK